MDPSTGTFTTMDTYQGSLFDPVSLHKYLYANDDPVTYCDPTGYMADVKSLSAGMAAFSIMDAAEAAYDAVCIQIGRKLIASLILGTASVIVTHAALNVLIDVRFIELLQQGTSNMAMVYMMIKVTELIQALQKAVDKMNKSVTCYYVYTLVDKDGVVRYVGSTKNSQS